MKEFIVENYQLIILICACLLDALLFILGYRSKRSFTPLGEVVAALPKLIYKAEKQYGAGNGSSKKLMVLDLAINLYKEITGVEVDYKSWIADEISSQIELILRTPQKKEGKIDEK